MAFSSLFINCLEVTPSFFRVNEKKTKKKQKKKNNSITFYMAFTSLNKMASKLYFQPRLHDVSRIAILNVK